MKIKNLHSKVILNLFTVIFLAATFSSGCSKSDSKTTNPGPDEVFIESFAFTPATLTVSVGTTITWTNKDGVAHTVTSDDLTLNSGLMETGGIYSHQFNTAGTFNYHCTVHPTMLAKVIVQ
jgi:plastocyanin